MNITEQAAEKRSVSDLRRVINASGLLTKSEVKQMRFEDVWGFVHHVVKGSGEPRPPPTSDPAQVSELLRGGIIECLIRLLIDFAILNERCTRRAFPVCSTVLKHEYKYVDGPDPDRILNSTTRCEGIYLVSGFTCIRLARKRYFASCRHPIPRC